MLLIVFNKFDNLLDRQGDIISSRDLNYQELTLSDKTVGCCRKGSEQKVEIGILHVLKLHITENLEFNENEQETL